MTIKTSCDGVELVQIFKVVSINEDTQTAQVERTACFLRET